MACFAINPAQGTAQTRHVINIQGSVQTAVILIILDMNARRRVPQTVIRQFVIERPVIAQTDVSKENMDSTAIIIVLQTAFPLNVTN